MGGRASSRDARQSRAGHCGTIATTAEVRPGHQRSRVGRAREWTSQAGVTGASSRRPGEAMTPGMRPRRPNGEALQASRGDGKPRRLMAAPETSHARDAPGGGYPGARESDRTSSGHTSETGPAGSEWVDCRREHGLGRKTPTSHGGKSHLRRLLTEYRSRAQARSSTERPGLRRAGRTERTWRRWSVDRGIQFRALRRSAFRRRSIISARSPPDAEDAYATITAWRRLLVQRAGAQKRAGDVYIRRTVREARGLHGAPERQVRSATTSSKARGG